MNDDKAIVKFNNSRLALLCSNCSVIIKEGKDFSFQEKQFVQGDMYLPPQYCEQCKSKEDGNNSKTESTELI